MDIIEIENKRLLLLQLKKIALGGLHFIMGLMTLGREVLHPL
jgi:hypothetical protein